MSTTPVVLVVDDDADLRLLIRRQMEIAGYEAIECADGAEAVRVASMRAIDLALLDVEMPGASGYDVLESFRTNPVLAAVPVLMMSSRSLAQDVVKGFGLGAQDYIRKPFELSELQARVDSSIEIRRLRVELEVRNDELELISRTDVMTGLFNRRHLREQLDISCAAGQRRGEPVSVLMVDVDHFKGFNDELGHSTCAASDRRRWLRCRPRGSFSPEASFTYASGFRPTATSLTTSPAPRSCASAFRSVQPPLSFSRCCCSRSPYELPAGWLSWPVPQRYSRPHRWPA